MDGGRFEISTEQGDRIAVNGSKQEAVGGMTATPIQNGVSRVHLRVYTYE